MQISAALDEFSEEYRKLKAPRKLQWKPSLGSVQLVVSAGGVQRELRVTPLQVWSILQSFCVHMHSTCSGCCMLEVTHCMVLTGVMGARLVSS
jgi:hypothetical protein